MNMAEPQPPTTDQVSHQIPPPVHVPTADEIEQILKEQGRLNPSSAEDLQRCRTLFATLIGPNAQTHEDLRQLATDQLDSAERTRTGKLSAVEAEIQSAESNRVPIESSLEDLRASFDVKMSEAGLMNDGDSPKAVEKAIEKRQGLPAIQEDSVEETKEEPADDELAPEPPKRSFSFFAQLLQLMRYIASPSLVAVCGSIFGVTFGTLTGFFGYADLEDGLTLSPKTMILFAIGPTIVWLIGSGLASITTIINRSERKGIAYVLGSIAGVVWAAEVIVEAYGLQDLYIQHAAAMNRASDHVVCPERAFIIFVIFGFLASSPYFIYKVCNAWMKASAETKVEKENKEREEAQLKRHLEIQKFILGSTPATEAVALAQSIQRRTEELRKVDLSLEELRKKKEELEKPSELSADLKTRLETAEKSIDWGLKEFSRLAGISVVRPEIPGGIDFSAR